jgi:hypothetical protein
MQVRISILKELGAEVDHLCQKSDRLAQEVPGSNSMQTMKQLRADGNDADATKGTWRQGVDRGCPEDSF